MIDHLIIIYKNYHLLDLQIKNFKKRFTEPHPFNLIVIDNTPNNEKMLDYEKYKNEKIIKTFCSLNSVEDFDGISHGKALDEGLKFCNSDIVCITDSDFFWLDPNIYREAEDKILKDGYHCFGSEYNDGTGDSYFWRNKNPKYFEEIPTIFGAFYKNDLAKCDTWVVTPDDVAKGKSEGFVEVGFKIRKKIIEKNLKSFTYKTNIKNMPYTSSVWEPCVFKDGQGKIKGIHYVGGSHANNNNKMIEKLNQIIESY